MIDWTEYLTILTGLIAIVNPVSAIPLYLVFTENTKHERPIVARHTSIAVGAILIICVFVGTHILNFFGISIYGFRIAGGLLLMMMAFNMLNVRQGRARHTAEEDQEAIESDSVAIVPLAMPLLAGPGAISTAILFSSQAITAMDKFLLVFSCVAAAFIVWLCLHLAPQISERLGRTGMNIFTRIMGLILVAISVEFILGGLKNAMPGLVS